jgi:hypothetical protein
MTFGQLVDYYGSQSAAARALGIEPPSVNEWKDKGIPEVRQLQLHKLTKGVLKADPAILAKYRAIFKFAPVGEVASSSLAARYLSAVGFGSGGVGMLVHFFITALC